MTEPHKKETDISNIFGTLKTSMTGQELKDMSRNDDGIELQVGVKILLRNDEGKYLLLKRSPEKYPEIGEKWDIVGGRINTGQTLLENLRREVKEETGLAIENEPVLVAAQDILRISGRHVVRLTYIGRANGSIVLTDEHTNFKWFTIDEMKNLANIDIYLKELLDRNIII